MSRIFYLSKENDMIILSMSPETNLSTEMLCRQY